MTDEQNVQVNESESEKLKRRISDDELAQIQKLLRMGCTYEEIAQKLGRSEKVIRDKINATKDFIKGTPKEEFVQSLHRKYFWEEIKKTLIDKAEEAFFENEWASIMYQFDAKDVLHNDEMMVRDLIMQDIETFRLASSAASLHKQKKILEDMVNRELEKDLDDRDLTQLGIWRQDIITCSAALVQITRERVDAQSKKDTIFKALRTTGNNIVTGKHSEVCGVIS